MRKIVFAFILILTPAVFGQGVELPDFVITGVQQVDLPVMEKARPEIISTVSKEFFTPAYSPEEFSLSTISEPELPKVIYFDRALSYSGFVKGGFGGFTIPVGEVFASKSFDNVDLAVNAWGRNEKEFVENADNNLLGVRFDSDFFISTHSSFLPGLQISLEGGYLRESFNLYGSPTPTFNRKKVSGFVSFDIKNTLDNKIKYGSKFTGSASNLNHNNIGESIFGNETFVKYKLLNILLSAEGFLEKQSLQNNLSQIDNYTYYGGEGSAKIKLSDIMDVEGGLRFSKQDGNYLFAPFGIVNIYFSKFLTLRGQYKPFTDFLTMREILDRNRYIILSQIDNVFEIYKHYVSAVLKYQYQKYYEINVGVGYSSIDNYLYFNDPAKDGSFDLFTIDEVKKLELFGSALFHLGPFGWFYGDAIYQKLEYDKFQSIPYQPGVKSSFIYGYPFPFGLELRSQLDLIYGIYADTNKNEKLPMHLNLSAGAAFNLFDSFKIKIDLQNLLNRDNNILRNYQQKPLDVIFGIDYSW